VNVEPSLWQLARWQIARGWPLGLLGLAVLAIVATTLWRGDPGAEPSGPEVQATISGFVPEDAPRFGRGIIVTATYRGLYGEADATLESVKGCKVGDPIRAVRHGAALVLRPWRCKG